MEVKVYTIPTCPWCVKLKDWLKKNKVAFQDFDLTESGSARDEMIQKSSQMATPVTIISRDKTEDEIEKIKNGKEVEIPETVIVGFNEEKLKETLKEYE
jgi:glutaredoxin 3